VPKATRLPAQLSIAHLVGVSNKVAPVPGSQHDRSVVQECRGKLRVNPTAFCCRGQQKDRDGERAIEVRDGGGNLNNCRRKLNRPATRITAVAKRSALVTATEYKPAWLRWTFVARVTTWSRGEYRAIKLTDKLAERCAGKYGECGGLPDGRDLIRRLSIYRGRQRTAHYLKHQHRKCPAPRVQRARDKHRGFIDQGLIDESRMCAPRCVTECRHFNDAVFQSVRCPLPGRDICQPTVRCDVETPHSPYLPAARSAELSVELDGTILPGARPRSHSRSQTSRRSQAGLVGGRDQRARSATSRNAVAASQFFRRLIVQVAPPPPRTSMLAHRPDLSAGQRQRERRPAFYPQLSAGTLTTERSCWEPGQPAQPCLLTPPGGAMYNWHGNLVALWHRPSAGTQEVV